MRKASRLLLIPLLLLSLGGQARQLDGQPAPDFTHTDPASWLNSDPLTLQQLKGYVLLIDFWTFDCWNCYRSFPWLHSVEDRFGNEGLMVIGVHTPEFEHERKLSALRKKVAGYGLEHPIMIDNDFSYWNAMGTSFWPTFYLIDKQGKRRFVFFGETHEGDKRAARVETAIRQLLAE